MSKAIYVGVEGIARKIKKAYVGVEGTARKVKKVYVGVGGVARQVYSAETVIQYTGDMTTSEITDTDGMLCILYTLTSSGTLTVDGGPVRAWCCGGGADGQGYSVAAADRSYVYSSGGGGGYTAEGMIPDGTHAVTIGGGQGKSSIGETLSANGTTGEDGGSGGGGGMYMPGSGGDSAIYYDGGTGQGTSTIPFGIVSLGKHCAGGGGGSGYGGRGGSNGSDGGNAASSNSKAYQGGERGGGTGGSDSGTSHSATFYGSGGGAAQQARKGYGYQGVAYILVPKE